MAMEGWLKMPNAVGGLFGKIKLKQEDKMDAKPAWEALGRALQE
jgi:hypothetical protein